MKIDPNFPYDMFKFLHKPIRDADKEVDNFTERYMKGMQTVWELLDSKIHSIQNMNNPAKIRADLLWYMKDIVGLTRDLRNITDGLSENDLRKIIILAVPLWKKKGIEIGFSDIVKLFTGFDSRVFNWFDYRMIIGEKAIGEEQLGEDSWVISRPGVEANTPEGLALLLLQFNVNGIIRDGSTFGNTIIPYGTKSWQSGGPFATSDFYLVGVNFWFFIPHRDIYDFTSNWTMETFFKTSSSQTIILFQKWDFTLGKGIQLIANTATNQVTYIISDGTTTDTRTIASGEDFDDNSWHHATWVTDWDKGTDGQTAIMVNGTRLFLDDLNGAMVKKDINNESNLFIGETSLGGAGVKASWDGIRITNDARYDIDNTTITVPGVNFVEYQEEQLDEFQMDIRVVDDGTLDRTLLKRILNLMRGSSERLNILYIDFYDAFESGKGQYKTVTGSGYTEETGGTFYLKMPPESLEIVEVSNSDDWKNYIVQHRCTIYDGEEFEVRFLVQDNDNFYAFRINSNLKIAYFEKVIAGVRTGLASSVIIDVESATLPTYIPYYVYMVSCFRNENTGVTTLRAFIDSNLTFSVDDTNFEKGSFGIYTPSGSTIWCSESEMFQMPLDHDRINPNDEF